MQPSIWIVAPSGIDDQAHVLGADHAFDLDASRCAYRPGPRRSRRRRCRTSVPTATPSPRPLGVGAGFQPNFSAAAFEDADGALVFEVLEPELDRVHLGLGGHDVDLRLAGEAVGVVAGGAPGAGGEGVTGEPPKPPPSWSCDDAGCRRTALRRGRRRSRRCSPRTPACLPW